VQEETTIAHQTPVMILMDQEPTLGQEDLDPATLVMTAIPVVTRDQEDMEVETQALVVLEDTVDLQTTTIPLIPAAEARSMTARLAS
jgi:hypothetical protein